ncbi:MAG: M10 family metallopeptidase domain-containing protein [Oscillospiraceae bacterium]|nr:M10 family metallopeptidase domain-containing protein [Oscillospiraceae bacterium]
MDDSATAWNVTATRVTVSSSTSSPNKILADNYADTWYGLSSSANPGPFTIKLNARTINAVATNFYNFVKSTLVHEYGHIFCLDHTAVQASIMYLDRNRNVMTTPQQFDISEVNSVYK